MRVFLLGPVSGTAVVLFSGGTDASRCFRRAGFKGQARVILPTITSCYECSLDMLTPPTAFPICTIANTPRLPEHCIEWASILEWPRVFKGEFGALRSVMMPARALLSLLANSLADSSSPTYRSQTRNSTTTTRTTSSGCLTRRATAPKSTTLPASRGNSPRASSSASFPPLRRPMPSLPVSEEAFRLYVRSVKGGCWSLTSPSNNRSCLL